MKHPMLLFLVSITLFLGNSFQAQLPYALGKSLYGISVNANHAHEVFISGEMGTHLFNEKGEFIAKCEKHILNFEERNSGFDPHRSISNFDTKTYYHLDMSSSKWKIERTDSVMTTTSTAVLQRIKESPRVCSYFDEAGNPNWLLAEEEKTSNTYHFVQIKYDEKLKQVVLENIPGSINFPDIFPKSRPSNVLMGWKNNEPYIALSKVSKDYKQAQIQIYKHTQQGIQLIQTFDLTAKKGYNYLKATQILSFEEKNGKPMFVLEMLKERTPDATGERNYQLVRPTTEDEFEVVNLNLPKGLNVSGDFRVFHAKLELDKERIMFKGLNALFYFDFNPNTGEIIDYKVAQNSLYGLNTEASIRHDQIPDKLKELIKTAQQKHRGDKNRSVFFEIVYHQNGSWTAILTSVHGINRFDLVDIIKYQE